LGRIFYSPVTGHVWAAHRNQRKPPEGYEACGYIDYSFSPRRYECRTVFCKGCGCYHAFFGLPSLPKYKRRTVALIRAGFDCKRAALIAEMAMRRRELGRMIDAGEVGEVLRLAVEEVLKSSG